MKKIEPQSIYELLDSEQFRNRTAMYIGKKSITRMKLYMDGYRTCELFNNIKTRDTTPPFWLFFKWICKYYNHSGSYYNWDGIILQNCDDDEEIALDTFFNRFDEFRSFKPIRIFSAQIDKLAVDFSNTHGRKRWQIINGDQIRIGPADKLQIVEYQEEFGCTIHHWQKNKIIYTEYFENLDLGIESAEKEYGNKIFWIETPKSELNEVYQNINF